MRTEFPASQPRAEALARAEMALRGARRRVHVAGMKRRIFAGLMTLVALVSSGRSEDKFSWTVQPEDFAAAGLGKLSSDERMRLDALVESYGRRVLAVEKREVAATIETQTAHEAKMRQAEQRGRATEARARGVALEKKTDRGFFSSDRVRVKSGTQVEYMALESKIAGEFRGWEGGGIITLENGQRWRIANGGSYSAPPVASPEVSITPAGFGGYWLKIVGVGQRVKVLPVEGR